MQTKPIGKKDYAKFTLLITYTYPVARKKGKPSQTFRDDLVTLNYENDGMKVKGLHPVYLLHRMFLELKMQTYCATIFDNSKQGREAVVFKAIICEGQTMTHPDRRADYYDLETGYTFEFLISKQLIA